MVDLPAPGADPRLGELTRKLGREAGARAYLEEVRWPGGVECPRCASDRVGFLATRDKHNCRDCAYQFRPTAGTVLHDSHVSISKWLLAVGLMLESERGFPATRLQAALGCSYKTAWFVEHRVRAAMAHALLGESHPVALALARSNEHLAECPQAEAELAPPEIRTGLRLIKQLAAGAYHRPSIEHLNAYWAEARWRDRHLDDENVYRKTVEALLAANPLPYARLTRHSRRGTG